MNATPFIMNLHRRFWVCGSLLFVYSAEQAALEQLGMAEAEHFVRLGQEHLNAIRTEFNKILQQEKV